MWTRVIPVCVDAVLVAAAMGAPSDAPEPPGIAIRASKILPVASAPIDNGVILVRGRIIEAVGPQSEVEIPAGYRIIDASGKWAFPGFIDLHAHVGGPDINDMVHPTNPELRVLESVIWDNPELRAAAAAGVTTINFIPGSGTNLSGFGTLMKTAGSGADDQIVRQPGVMKVAQAYNPERAGGDLGAGRMGMSWGLIDLLERGRDYNAEWAAFERGTRTTKPEVHLNLEPLRGLFERKFPVLIHTAGARDVVSTVRMFHDQFGLRTIVSHGCFNAWRSAAELAKVPDLFVNLGPRNYDFNATGENRFVPIFTEYWKAGVKNITINTDSPVVPEEELFVQGSVAVRLGLPWEIALKAMTLGGAEALGVADRIGSLAPGCDADIVIKDGEPFDIRTRIRLVLVSGRVAYDSAISGFIPAFGSDPEIGDRCGCIDEQGSFK
ncbi:MAG: amidohydrolase family protein [Planctomycetes bacterium]|nr:amidohydrolase family protein [Planctomycetota bacterium]MBI3843077.1 amidohydrolase family protein [Planctomycetota bacterium]